MTRVLDLIIETYDKPSGLGIDFRVNTQIQTEREREREREIRHLQSRQKNL